MPVNQPGRTHDTFLLKMLGEHILYYPGMFSPVISIQIRSSGRQMVSQAQEKDIDTRFPGITEVTVNSPARGQSLLAHLGRPEVVPDQSLHQFYLPDTEPQSFQHIGDR